MVQVKLLQSKKKRPLYILVIFERAAKLQNCATRLSLSYIWIRFIQNKNLKVHGNSVMNRCFQSTPYLMSRKNTAMISC